MCCGIGPKKEQAMAQDVEIKLGDTPLKSGDTLRDDRVTARLYGKKGMPLIVVLGGISATRFVADEAQKPSGWWANMVGEQGPVDLNHFQVLGLDYAPQTTASSEIVSITTEDQAGRLCRLLDHLGIQKIAAIIGASYGGMVAQAFAIKAPKRVQALCIISAAHQPFPMGLAWRGIQRRIVRLALASGNSQEGLALARELAMTTYRSAEEFSARFDGLPTASSPTRFDVCDYLQVCGSRFAGSMPAERFLALCESIDLHRIEPEHISTPAWLIASDTDQLAPPSQMREFKARLGGVATLHTLNSRFGHDAFLKETEALGKLLHSFTQEVRHGG
jgi:homoserine O-acetyltransferase/O-succinyltransferase